MSWTFLELLVYIFLGFFVNLFKKIILFYFRFSIYETFLYIFSF